MPLQRSLFAGISRAPAVIGIHGVLLGDRFDAWLDQDGDLYLDQTDIERLVAALPALATPGFLAEMRRRLTATCGAALEATERSHGLASSVSATEARTLLSELGGKVAALLPYGVLSKFVPDALYEVLKADGDTGDPPFPVRSPASELTRAAAALSVACQAQGFSPHRLRTEWPEVAPNVAALVRDFCQEQRGFGPLAWEAPGYEDPHYVFDMLAGSFGDGDPNELLRRLGPIDPRAKAGPAPPREASVLRHVLTVWLDFLDRETWYVRRAFYVGMVPLLRRVMPAYRQADSGFVPEDLLFLELNELTLRPPETGVAAARREKYLADTEYHAKYGISPDRLRAVMEAL